VDSTINRYLSHDSYKDLNHTFEKIAKGLSPSSDPVSTEEEAKAKNLWKSIKEANSPPSKGGRTLDEDSHFFNCKRFNKEIQFKHTQNKFVV